MESEQRKKREQGHTHEPKYFGADENGLWKFKNNITVAELLTGKVESAPVQVNNVNTR